MSLLNDLIIKDLTVYEEFSLRNFDIRAISYFFKAYAISLQVTGEKQNKKVNRLWKKLINDRLNNLKSNNMSKIQLIIPSCFKTISNATKDLREQDESMGLNKGEYWKKGLIGIQIYGGE
jgi:hypothetical protein